VHDEVSYIAFLMKYVNQIKENSECLFRPVTLTEETQDAYKHLIKKSKAKRSKEVTEALDTRWQNVLFVYTTTHCSFKAYCAILVRCSNFRHQVSPRVLPCESTERWKVELWARNFQEFCLNVDHHVTFRDLLHAVKLCHGTDGFTSPPKEGVLRIFSP
jgi:hypothetical protein